jgi:hypothetical protein
VVARDGHAARRGERPLEALAPVVAGEIDAGAAEIGGRKRQDDVRFAAQVARGFEAKEIRAARGRSVRRDRREGGKSFPDALAHLGTSAAEISAPGRSG